MKRTKVLILVVILIIGSFSLSGCFFGSSDGDSVPEGEVLEADFSMEERGGQLYLDASPTVIEGYEDPEYAWQVNGTSYNGEKIDMSAPDNETDIKLTVKAHKDNNTVTDSKTKTYQPGETNDDDVNFSSSRIGSKEYEFVASEPSNAVYWEWRIEGNSSWYGYEDENKYNHTFSSTGDKKVELRILDKDEEVIGKTEKTIDVY